jgi:hypothetical protein
LHRAERNFANIEGFARIADSALAAGRCRCR